MGDLAEVRAFVEMIEAVYQPDNPLPLLGYLRGPLVGLGDDELYCLKEKGGIFEYRHSEAIPHGLPDEIRERLQEAYGRLDQIERRVQRLSPAVAFEQTCRYLTYRHRVIDNQHLDFHCLPITVFSFL